MMGAQHHQELLRSELSNVQRHKIIYYSRATPRSSASHDRGSLLPHLCTGCKRCDGNSSRQPATGQAPLRSLPEAQNDAQPRGRSTPRNEGGNGGCGCENQNDGCGNANGGWGLDSHPLAMVYSPLQHFRDIYDPEIALGRGTLFAELDLPFEGDKNKNGGGCRLC